MIPLEALTLKVPTTVTPLVGILTPVVLELWVLGVIHIVLIVLHDLRTYTQADGNRSITALYIMALQCAY